MHPAANPWTASSADRLSPTTVLRMRPVCSLLTHPARSFPLSGRSDVYEGRILIVQNSFWRQAFPNMGFQQQLRLWEAMGCRLDPDNGAYRRYALAATGRRWAEDGVVDQTTLPMPTDADADQVCGWS